MQTVVEYRVEASVATITLNRPECYNSLNTEMCKALQQALRSAQKNARVRAVVITGKGKAFCAGQDLQEMTQPDAPAIREVLEDNHNPVVLQIRQMGKPVVAAVNGVAAGAGAVIALACDLCIAAESASFMMPFSKIGLTPGSGGTFFLPRLVGLQKAMSIMLLGEKVSAAEAERIGMIAQWTPDETLYESAHTMAQQLAMLPALSLQLTKQALQASCDNDLETQIKLENDLKCLAGESADYKEGLDAFIQKRKPQFNQEQPATNRRPAVMHSLTVRRRRMGVRA